MAGSLEKRGKNSWRLVVSGGMGPGGRRKKHTRTIKTTSRREAEKELAKFVAEVNDSQYIEPSKMTLNGFVDSWIKDYGEKNLAPMTLFRYKLLLERILPAMGHLNLENIKPIHLLNFYSNLQENGIRSDGKPGGLSEQTILHHHRLISAILQDAVEWQVLQSNPAQKVKPPKVKKKQAKYYDEKQTSDLLKAVQKEPIKYQVLVILAISTGLRKGEILGLEWEHIDWDNRELHVVQTSQYIQGKGLITKEPKNDTSNRTVSVPHNVITLLKEYNIHEKKRQLKVGDAWNHSNRLFTTWDGSPMHPNTVNNWFGKFVKKHNLTPLPFHGLRHTAATLLINQNVHIKTISNRLGHSNISTTMDIYGHALKSADKEAAEKLDTLFYVDSN